MFKNIAIVALAIVMIISFNSAVFAKNNKTNCDSGINPAGKSDRPGFNHGNAWWKNNQHKQNRNNNRALLKATISDLEAQVADLRNQIVLQKSEIEFLQEDVLYLESELDNQSCPEAAPMLQAYSVPEQNWDAEARKFAIYKMAIDHPNTPDAYGVYTNFFVPASEIQNIITAMDSGSYNVVVRVEDELGNVVNIETDLEADLTDRDFYDHYIQLQ